MIGLGVAGGSCFPGVWSVVWEGWVAAFSEMGNHGGELSVFRGDPQFSPQHVEVKSSETSERQLSGQVEV